MGIVTIDDITFDHVLKDPEAVRELLLGFIARDLNDCECRRRALTLIRKQERKGSKVEDLLKFLTYWGK